MRTLLTILFLASTSALLTQEFTKITTGDIGADPTSNGYAGASWIDFDSDGDVDLFVNPDRLYANDGTGILTTVTGSGISGVNAGLNNGNSWADIDNDGDLDMVLVNQNTNSNGVYSNNGDGTFSLITEGDIGINLNAWSAAWADYNNDGWVDLLATHPCGFIGSCHTNWLFDNAGDGTFNEVASSDVTTGLAAYTVGSWADYDDDGDMDLFVGSGEVNVASQDHIYVNQLVETGTADLVLTQSGTLFGDTRDGQNWNHIDYDNDGDLDAFVTNYKSDLPNDFYSNNGDGTFTELGLSDLGVHMTTEAGVWLANTWGDFNNDGWLDVVITADFGSQFGNHMYLNNGDGTFEHHFPSFANIVGSRSVVNGDYDNDGDLDLFINGSTSNVRGLYRNDLDPGIGENWLSVGLEGTSSNRSAVGATVKILVEIGGQSMWLRRDVSTQNGFCGQNDMRLHFGLGDATQVDSLVIDWPLGLVESYGSQNANLFLSFIEGMTIGVEEQVPNSLFELFPNPVDDQLSIKAMTSERLEVRIINMQGAQIMSRVLRFEESEVMQVNTKDLSPGIYMLIFVANDGKIKSRSTFMKY